MSAVCVQPPYKPIEQWKALPHKALYNSTENYASLKKDKVQDTTEHNILRFSVPARTEQKNHQKKKGRTEMKKEINIKKAESFAKYMTVTIVGTSDLVLNKMNAWTVRYLVSDDRKKTLASRNVWEDIITAAHWRDELPRKKPEDWSEQDLRDLLKNNAPCISAFGLKKSFGDAVVRAGLDKYKTKFDASVNIIANNNLIPIVFAQHCVDEKLMSPKKGAPVLARLNRFVGWSATFTVQYLETVYSAEQIADIINIAGFGIGIGSGRSSGYGRYELESKS